MGKYAVFLIVAGIAIWLWLSLDPSARTKLAQWWELANTSQAGAGERLLTSLREWQQQASEWLVSLFQPTAPPALVAVANWLHGFWQAVWQLWLSLLRRLNMLQG